MSGATRTSNQVTYQACRWRDRYFRDVLCCDTVLGHCARCLPIALPIALQIALASLVMIGIAQGAPASQQSDQDVSAEQVDRFLKNQTARIAAIARAKQATISVFASSGSNGGSGVLIDESGYAITNYHVVQPCGNFMKCSLPNGKLYDAVLIGIDPVGDVALIRLISDEPFPVAEIADSNDVRVGDSCFAIGNPFLLATDFQPTVTYGIVSGVHRYQEPAGTLLEYTDCLQTDAAINPGNSGGPLFNSQGQLIGINGRGSFEKRGRVNVGVGFAISINQVQLFLGCLKSGRILDHATLGATVGYDDLGRVVVTNLLVGSDAYRRNLRVGDVMQKLGNRPIDSVNTFKNVLGIYPRGWRVAMEFSRDGQHYQTMVRLTGVHSREELVELIQGPLDAQRSKLPQDDEATTEAPQAEAPDELAHLHESRYGFANYLANRQARDRVWSQIQSTQQPTESELAISLRGTWNGAGEARLRLSRSGCGLEINGLAELLSEDSELNQQLAPDGSGGLLLALYVWRRLLAEKPESFGDVYYYGTAQYEQDGPKYDVIIGTFGTIETRAYVSPTTGRLVYLEVFPDVLVDPCVLQFDDYRPVNERLVPHRIDVISQEQPYGSIRITESQIELE